MVAFNAGTPAPANVPNFTGRSQGTGPDRSFEALFTGLTQTAANVLDIKDQATEKAIYDEADASFQSVNKEFGFDPQESTGASPDASGTPTGLQEGVDRMSTLQAAFDQGKINEVNYYGRLATLSKQMRSKYPGYEKVVDATIQSVTGTRPANAYRDALLSSLRAGQESVSNEEKFRRQWIKENQGELAAIYGEDFFKNPDAYDFNDVQGKVAGFQAEALNITREKSRLDLEEKSGQINEKNAAKTLDREMTFVATSIGNRALNLNGDKTTVLQRINDFAARGGGNSQEVSQFITAISGLETNVRQELTKRADQYVMKGWVSRADANASIDAAMQNIKWAKEAVLGGDFKLAARYATVNKIAEDESVDKLYNADPRFKIGAGMRAIDESMGQDFFMQHSKELSDIGLEVAGQAIAGRTDAVKLAVESGNQKVARQAIQTSVSILRDGNASPDAVDKLVAQFFGTGPNTVRWMDKQVVSEADQERLYLTFTNPEVTKNIFAKGSEESKKMYTEWARSGAANIPSIRRLGDDLMIGQANGMEIGWDDKSNQITLGFKGGTSWSSNYAVEGMKSLNRVLKTLQPIAEAEGVDPKEFAKGFIGSLRLQYGATDSRSIFKRIYDAIPKDGDESKTMVPKSSGSALEDAKISGVNFMFDPSTEINQPNAASAALDDLVQDDSLDDIDFVDGDDEDGDDIPDLPDTVDSPAGRGKEALTDTPGRNLPLSEAGQFLQSRSNKPPSHIQGLNGKFQSRLAGMMNDPDAPKGLGIYSGYRSPERQRELWTAALKKYGSVRAARRWVAPPGRSNHNHGQAVDLSWNGKSLKNAPADVVRWVHRNAERYGLKFPLGNENWHVEMQETRGGKAFKDQE